MLEDAQCKGASNTENPVLYYDKTQYASNITSSNTRSCCFKLNIFWINNHINFVIGLLCHWNNIRRLRRRGNSRHKTSTQISKWSTPGMHNSYSCCWHM